MSYLSNKANFMIESARRYCGVESEDPKLRHLVAVDVMELAGKLFAMRDPKLLEKGGALLSLFPLLKTDAREKGDADFLDRLQRLEDACLSIQVSLQKKTSV